MKTLFVHSFHSQVPTTVSNLDEWFDLVICLDSHVDDFIPPAPLVDAFPGKVKLAARRAAAHTELRMCTGGLPALREPGAIASEMLLVVPRRSMYSSLGELNRLLEIAKTSRRSESITEISPAEYEEALSRIYGINVYYSPPNDLMNLVERARGTNFLLDIDIDFMSDMQKECYSPLKEVEPGELNWSDKVLRFISQVKTSNDNFVRGKG